MSWLFEDEAEFRVIVNMKDARRPGSSVLAHIFDPDGKCSVCTLDNIGCGMLQLIGGALGQEMVRIADGGRVVSVQNAVIARERE